MKNLSLQSMQATSMKTVTESSNKGDLGASKSGKEKSAFQMALSDQVHVKRMQAKQSQGKSAQDIKTSAAQNAGADTAQAKQGAADQLVAKLQAHAKTNKGMYAAEVSESIRAAQDGKDGDTQLIPSGVSALLGGDLVAKTGSVAADDAEVKERELVTPVDANAVAATAMVTMVMAPSPHFDTQNPATFTTDIAPQIQQGLEELPANSFLITKTDSTQAQQSLDVSLSGVLSAGKPIGTAGESRNNQPDLTASNMVENTRWLDAMLPSVVKQSVVADELAGSKFAFNTSQDNIGRDSSVKDITLTATNFQSNLQAAAVSSQQVGSGNTIASYPGKAGWDQAISQKVVWMLGAGEQSATLTLNPPDLGPLQVVIHVHNNQADTTFMSDNAQVRQALEDGMANLRDKMSESGIQLGQANVSTNNQSQQEFQRATQNRSASGANVDSTPQLPSMESGELLVRVGNGLVDTFA